MQIGRSERVAVMPHVALEALRKCSDSDASPKDLEKVLAADPGLSARVIKLANCPLYTTGAEVTTVSGAVQVLGLRALKGVIYAAAYDEAIAHVPGAAGIDRKAMWLHSLLTAFAAREMAPYFEGEQDKAYVSGLLHEIGLITLARHAPEVVARILAAAEQEARPIDEVATDVLGFTAGDLGAVIAEKWRLGEHVAAAARYITRPALDASDITRPTTLSVAAGHVLALKATAKPGQEVNAPASLQERLAAFPQEELDSLMERANAGVQEVTSVFSK